MEHLSVVSVQRWPYKGIPLKTDMAGLQQNTPPGFEVPTSDGRQVITVKFMIYRMPPNANEEGQQQEARADHEGKNRV